MSGLVTISLEFVHLPAALMLGPMVAGILMETGGGSVRVPYIPLNAAQAVIGCMIGRSITPTTIEEFGHEWSLFLGVVSIIVVASSALGYLLSRLRVLSGTTAVWGLLPGAAPAMIFMAEAFGADFRLVAFMQYLRVVLVAVAASAIALLWMPPNLGAAAAHSTVMFPEMHIGAFAVTLCVASVSLVLGIRSKVPAGVLIFAMAIAAVLHVLGWASIELPPWFLAVSYAVMGWNIGLRFTREVLAAAARALPQTLMSIMILIGFCAGLAAILVKVLGVDPLTAYLATSPGGVDSVAIIAASTPVDVPFVIALQTVRFLLILMVGPSLSGFVARLVSDPGKGPKSLSNPRDVQELKEELRNDVGDLD
jgi:membrane AbrB-like protein